jgi:hypothetical protein
MTDPLKKIGFRNGFILGCLLILFSTYINVYRSELYADVWLGFAAVFVIIAFGILSILQTKKRLGGLISFKEAFSSYFYTILLGSFMSSFYLLLLYLFILSPETKEVLKQVMIDYGINTMKQNLATQKDIDQALVMSKTLNPFSAQQVLAGFIKYLLRDCLIGFLVALIFRNKRTL